MFNSPSHLATAIILGLSLTAPVIAKTNIKFELSSQFNPSQQKKVKQWLHQGLTAVEESIAPLPFQQVKFSVLKHHNNTQAVPWGQIVRGRPNTVKLHISAKASLTELSEDWTLYHEISHLYLPYLNYSSFWLGEGFASYMQYIIMYQAGWLDRRQFLKKIEAGFERGRRKTLTTPGELKDVAANMWELRAYRRVYWSGAAYFLEADLALHKKGLSLSEVMTKYVDCCLRGYSRGNTLAKQLDRLSDSNIFVPLFNKYANRTDFPVITDKQLNTVADFYAN